MVKPSYKAIILILASDNEPIYKFFRQVYMKYLDRNPEVRVFFVYGDGTTFDRQSHDLVYDDLKESLICPWPTTKVIRAMEYIDNNFDYQYLVRTNLSTFWDLDRLVARLEQYPRTGCLTGTTGIFDTPITGIAMVLSPDLVKMMVTHQSEINVKFEGKNYSEDYLLSSFITKNNHAQLVPGNQYTKRFESYDTFDPDRVVADIRKARDSGVDNFRIKSKGADRRMLVDTQVAISLLQEIYGIQAQDLNPNVRRINQ
jgi:hypothetical protein